jgi:hypothetical protein
MGLTKKIFPHPFFIRLGSWEYWPFWVVQFPMMMYWLWLSLRARSLLFFSASNPSILLGGMFGESKYDVLKDLPAELIPRTALMKMPLTIDQVMHQLEQAGLHFPLVFKPDIGERGFLVKRIYSMEDVANYLQRIRVDFIAQELVELPVEGGVFYTRFPNDPTGKVTSIVLKEMLSVTGDGRSSIQELIFQKDRARLQWPLLKEMYADRLEKVLALNEQFELNSIGNHCLGTKFLDGRLYITDELSASFDRISKKLGDFYFGRFDLKCASVEALQRGEVKIIEVNGCGAEPAHIYQPGYSLWNAYSVLTTHWKNLFTISVQNNKRGHSFTSFREGLKIYRHFRSRMKNE